MASCPCPQTFGPSSGMLSAFGLLIYVDKLWLLCPNPLFFGVGVVFAIGLGCGFSSIARDQVHASMVRWLAPKKGKKIRLEMRRASERAARPNQTFLGKHLPIFHGVHFI